MGVEIEKTTEGVLHDNNKRTHPTSTLQPQTYGFCSDRGYPVKKVSIFLKNRPEFSWHCQSDAKVGNVGKSGFEILLPRLRGTLSAAGTESRLAGVVHKLQLSP